MLSRTQYVTMEMPIPIKKNENAMAAFEQVRRVHGQVTDLKTVSVVGHKTDAAVVTVSFVKRVRLSKAQRMQA